MFERDETSERDDYFDPPGGAWEDFEAEGELVTVSGGPQKDDLGGYLAYSTLMAEWLRTPKSRLLSFVRHSACSPQQALAMDRHLHWFEWEFNCFARNRRGIIKATKQIIADIIAEAEELDDADKRKRPAPTRRKWMKRWSTPTSTTPPRAANASSNGVPCPDCPGTPLSICRRSGRKRGRRCSGAMRR